MNISVKYNDIELDKYMIVNDIRRGIGAPRANTLQKMGMAHGESFIGATRDALIYEMEFTLLYDVLDKRRELAGILNVDEPKMLIFGDEPSLACLAIPDGTIDVEEKMFHGVGTIKWVIPSGFSFALNTRKFTASMSADNILSMEVDNRGTVETPLSVRAEIKDDNGYFGIVGPNSAMEFGKILEADGYVDMSEWVFVDQLDNKTSDWFINTGTIEWKNSNVGNPNLIQGNLEFKNGKVVPTTWGTQPTDNRWYGPTLSRNISAKKTDGRRDGNWRLRFWLVHKSHGDPKKLGRQEINLSRNNTNSNVTFAIYDDVSGSNKTVVQFKILGEVKFGFKVNENFTEFYGSVDIWKEDDTIYLKLFSNDTKSTATYSYSDERYKTLEFDKLTYWASRYRNYPICEMSFNYVDFQWIGTQKFVDVPNRYADGMTLNYNGDSGKFYVNDVPTMNDIVQGSIDIMIPPGKWTVEFYYSDFCEIPPVVTAEIRERWL